jgi:hypothetical protein
MSSTRVADMKESIGKEQRFIASDLQRDSFVLTPIDGEKTALTWRRVH